MPKRRLIYTAIRRPFIKIFVTFTCSIKDALHLLAYRPKKISQCVQPCSQGLFPSQAMEKVLENIEAKRLIVCCLEVLPLRPFTVFSFTVEWVP